MKATSSTLLLTSMAIVGACLLASPDSARANPQAAPTAEAAQPQKRSLFSRFRRNKTPEPQQVAPQQQAAAPQSSYQAGAQPAEAAAQPEEKKRRFSLRMPRFAKPDFSKIPKPRLPKVKMPEIRMPQMNVKMPKLRWPFGRRDADNRQTIQDYPNGVRNPRLGGAFGIVRAKAVNFYEFGPSQPFGPDEVLKSGELITIRSNDRSWAYVTLKDGRSGYVGLDQVRLAAEKEVPASLRRPVPAAELLAENEQPFLIEGSDDYVPPTLPAMETAAPGAEAEAGNPLLGMAQDPGVPGTTTPVDTPEVLFDPLLEPLDPIVPEIPGGPEPFLNDPIPSIEEELRAIQEAKARAAEDGEPADDGGGEEEGA